MEEMTIAQIQSDMARGRLNAVDLTRSYLDRIARLDQAGPGVNAVIEVNPEALAEAERLDGERIAGRLRSALHGTPILIKDNIETLGPMATSAGSLALAGNKPGRDADVMARLRAAGVVVLGKTNLSEWANFRSTHSSSGWSSRGGQTRNPYALDRSPCGSSSGSGAAVAANFCAAAVGTETDGSIVCPAHANGIVGLKPTLGLISRRGIVPIAHSQDTAGPMARCVADAAWLLGTMIGIDPADPETAAAEGKALSDYTAFLDTDGLRGARLGVARNYCGFDARVDQILEDALAAMRSAGAEVIDLKRVAPEASFEKYEGEVLFSEFKSDLTAYLQSLGQDCPVHSLADVIRYNEENASRVMPYFGQERMLLSQAKGSLRRKRYQEALTNGRRQTRELGLDAAIKEYRLDAIVAPTGGPAWLIDLVNGDQYIGGGFTSPAAVAGYPHITVPAGWVRGLPIGVSFVAGAWQEPVLIRLAYAFEQATRVRQPPKFRPSAELEGLWR